MIFSDFTKALAQAGDPKFRRVVILGILLALGLLFGLYAILVLILSLVTPDQITLPWIGEIGGIHEVLSWVSLVAMMGLSVFLMVPVASLFTGIFLDEVADAVEEKHHAYLPQVRHRSFAEMAVQSSRFLAVMVIANLIALIFYIFLAPFAPLIWVGLNGYLLSREYFTMVAERRLSPMDADALRKRHRFEIWFAGCLMTAPLLFPFISLLIPVFGVATFTHLYHRLPQS
ncbi:EI24 domain-containing protein [Halocynthiibacter namhaensis]|uniref:EI24 domain-containing protein n=1 Tax=Halocynthiibacter namhaensis TaxID=1290553 RepID=UPI0005798AD8